MDITNKFYHDETDGWLAVKTKVIEELGLADKISKHSYIKGKTIYLEEVNDMPKYIDAQKSRGNTAHAVSIGHGERSIVRNYEMYHAPVGIPVPQVQEMADCAQEYVDDQLKTEIDATPANVVEHSPTVIDYTPVDSVAA